MTTAASVVLLLAAGAPILAASSSTANQPSFFLQDPIDGQCLAGETFKRCGVDTLWYVSGTTTMYQLHHRPVEEDEKDMCLDRVKCGTSESFLKLGGCRGCCAKAWNILGDADNGYVLTEGEGNNNCLHRDGAKAKIVDCSEGYVGLALQFASKEDIALMMSPGARFIAAAADGDKAAVEKLLKDGLDVNSQDWDRLTALIAAASGGHLNVVSLLLKK
ncbi:unnamed protein product, partial [Discosporangium mesarthrocarpum]